MTADAAGNGSRDGAEQAFTREGFGEDDIHAGDNLLVELVSPTRQEHGTLALEIAGQGQSGHAWHAEVGDHEIDGLASEQGER